MNPRGYDFCRPRASRFRWGIVGLLCAVAFVLYVDRGNITVAAPHRYRVHCPRSAGPDTQCLFVRLCGGLGARRVAGRPFWSAHVLTAAGVDLGRDHSLAGPDTETDLGTRVDAVALLVFFRFLLGLCEACAYPTFNRALANWMRAANGPRERTHSRRLGFRRGVHSGLDCADYQSFRMAAIFLFIICPDLARDGGLEPAGHR